MSLCVDMYKLSVEHGRFYNSVPSSPSVFIMCMLLRTESSSTSVEEAFKRKYNVSNES